MSNTELFGSNCSLEGSATATDLKEDVFSDFGDETCGEPEIRQHLILDFTPDPEIDNAISQKKICDFFNFINNMPDIQNLKIKPEKCENGADSDRNTGPDLFKQETKENVVDMTRTACSMLEVVEEKDLIKRAFEGRIPGTVCSLGSYKEEEGIQEKKKAQRGHFCKCTKPCKTCTDKNATKQLCTKLEQWDAKHPKSMDPPGHAPKLQHYILQRQVFEY